MPTSEVEVLRGLSSAANGLANLLHANEQGLFSWHDSVERKRTEVWSYIARLGVFVPNHCTLCLSQNHSGWCGLPKGHEGPHQFVKPVE